MENSLFHKDKPEDRPPTPYELIEPEIIHLKKGYAIRHGPKAQKRTSPWVIILVFCGLVSLYVMDPVLHAWYKGEAIETYLYLHNYGSGSMTAKLVASQILTPDEVHTLNGRQGAFQDYYPTPEAADRDAQVIIDYMNNVRLLHAGKYETLNPVGRLRYALFIYPGMESYLPTDCSFLDPSVGD